MAVRWLTPLAVASLLALLTGCSRRTEPPSTEAPVVAESAPAARVRPAPPVFRGQPTSTLPLSADTARRVESLVTLEKETRGDEHVRDEDPDARQRRLPHIEHRRQGISRIPSALAEAAKEMVTNATLDELRLLLGHESVVVRAYVGSHVWWHQPLLVEDAAALLKDETPLSVPEGCLSGESTVRRHMIRSMCYRENTYTTDLLASQAQSSGYASLDALGCLALHRPEVTLAQATERLSEPLTSDERPRLWSTLETISRRAPWQVSCPGLLALSHGRDEGLRLASAGALSLCESDLALQRYRLLTDSGSGAILRTGDSLLALVQHPRTPMVLREQLLSDAPRAALIALHIQEQEDRPPPQDVSLSELLPLVVTLSVAHPREMAEVVARLPESPALWPALQQITNLAPALDGKRSAKTVSRERLGTHSHNAGPR